MLCLFPPLASVKLASQICKIRVAKAFLQTGKASPNAPCHISFAVQRAFQERRKAQTLRSASKKRAVPI